MLQCSKSQGELCIAQGASFFDWKTSPYERRSTNYAELRTFLGVVALSQTERNLPTIANVDARDSINLACWFIIQIGPISLNVTTPPEADIRIQGFVRKKRPVHLLRSWFIPRLAPLSASFGERTRIFVRLPQFICDQPLTHMNDVF